jgi:predicted metal-binding membrane protein
MTSTLEVEARPADRADRAFLAVSALIFAVSASVTVVWCASMSSMDGMRMPGGWTMSMAWMRMPGQSWPGAAAMFLGMWAVMMVAMMLPSLVGMLWRHRQAAHAMENTHAGLSTAWVGAGYFVVWILAGVVVYAVGVVLAALAMQDASLARAVPIWASQVVIAAGLLQFTTWKLRSLACCRVTAVRPHSGETLGAWASGMHLGVRCLKCCVGPMAVLLVLGVMELRAMAVVATAITIERLAKRGELVARVTGVVTIAAGFVLLIRAAGLA